MNILGILFQGITANQSKIASTKDWPRPKNLKVLQGFLGLTVYYRRFVEGYGKMAWPLTQLLKKDSFGWSDPTEGTFNKLKEAMTIVPILALLDFSQPFILETDASRLSLGAVLMQNQRSIAYFS